MAARASGATAGRGRTGAADHRCRGRGRACVVLQSADHYVELPAGIHAGGAGRQIVRAARVHEDLRHGGRCRARGDVDSGADVLLPAWQRAAGAGQSVESRAHRALSATDCRRAAFSARHTVAVGVVAGRDDRAGDATRQRIHAAAHRRRSVVHALGTAGSVRREGGTIAAADRQGADAVSRSGTGVRQSGSRGDRHRSGGSGNVRDHDPVQAARTVADGQIAGRTHRRDERGATDSGTCESVGAADPQSHRHAVHGHQEPRRHQDCGAGSARHRTTG